MLLLRHHPPGHPPHHWNDHPIPFTWTKDADQLLGKTERAKTKTIGLTDYQVVSQRGSRESCVLEVSTYRMTQAAGGINEGILEIHEPASNVKAEIMPSGKDTARNLVLNGAPDSFGSSHLTI